MLKIGNKVFRNLQEQVGYNTSQIEKIFETLDGLNIQDNVVAVSDISQVLTDDEMVIVRRTVAFMAYNGELYIKRGEDASTAYFDIIFSVSESSGVVSLNSKEIQVTLSNGGLALVTATQGTYTTTKIDSLLAAKANLSGANFTGEVTAPSIVENMVGYSFESIANYGYTIENVYVGAVKNGNKLTLVCAFNITRTEDDPSGSVYVGRFNIPSAVAAKLYETDVGGTNYLANQETPAWAAAWTAVSQRIFYNKGTNSVRLAILGSTALNLTKNTTYFVRAEVTFLLSDSLA